MGAVTMAIRRMSEIARNQNPLMLPIDTTIKQACQCMKDRRVGAVLVTDDNRHLLGIFTGRDAVCRVLAEGKDSSKVKLGEVMTPSPTTIPPRESAIEALRLMRDGGFRHVPIVDGRKVVGVVSKGDFRGVEQDRLDEESGIWERI
jgi:CBS domain-containing protein